jgi:cytidylate kinase
MTFVIAIDGPAGTGKSSTAHFLAQQLSFVYIDTGAIYRALAFLVDKYKKDVDDIEGIVALIPRILIDIDEKTNSSRTMIDGQFVERELRTENISRLSSLVSQHKKVREALLPVQRTLIKKIHTGAIFEGRDIGTVVFPYAPLKIFITANSETRAQRRYEEIMQSGKEVSYDEVLHAIKMRDERDEKRINAPMQKAIDAHVIDTSQMTLEQVTKKAMNLIKSAMAHGNKGNQLW